MFRNCLKFHEKGSEFYTHGKILEEFLDKFLEQWLPDYAFESFETSESLRPKFNPEPSTSGTGKKRKKKHSSDDENESPKRKAKKAKKDKKKKKKKNRARRSEDIKKFINDGDPEEESDEDSPIDDNLFSHVIHK